MSIKKLFKCAICESSFGAARSLSEHIKEKHPNTTTQEYYDIFVSKDDNNKYCPVCGNTNGFINIVKGYYKHCSSLCASYETVDSRCWKHMSGKSYDEIYGVERAREIRDKLIISQNRRYGNIPYKKQEYSLEFRHKREIILKKYNNICQVCGKLGNIIHHVDYNKDNNDENNLIVTCNSCNVVVNYNRDYWLIYFARKNVTNTLIGGIDFDSKKIAIVIFDTTDNSLFSCSLYWGDLCFITGPRSFERSWEMFYFYWDKFTKLPIRKLYIENPARINNITTAIVLGSGCGVLKILCWLRGITFELVHPATWKKEVLKNGGAKKEQIASFVDVNYPVLKDKEQDIKDACCVAVFGLRREAGIAMSKGQEYLPRYYATNK